MRQVNADEIDWVLFRALQRITPAVWKRVSTGTPEQKRQALQIVAGSVRDNAFRRYEVLSNGPPAHDGAFAMTDKWPVGEA